MWRTSPHSVGVSICPLAGPYNTAYKKFSMPGPQGSLGSQKPLGTVPAIDVLLVDALQPLMGLQVLFFQAAQLACYIFL